VKGISIFTSAMALPPSVPKVRVSIALVLLTPSVVLKDLTILMLAPTLSKHLSKHHGEPSSRMVKKLEWIEMAQLAVSSILFKSLSLKLP